jgi:hypothetical protein
MLKRYLILIFLLTIKIEGSDLIKKWWGSLFNKNAEKLREMNDNFNRRFEEYNVTHNGRFILKFSLASSPNEVKEAIPDIEIKPEPYLNFDAIKRVKQGSIIIESNFEDPKTIENLQKAFHMALDFNSDSKIELILTEHYFKTGKLLDAAYSFYSAICIATIYKDLQEYQSIPALKALQNNDASAFEATKNNFTKWMKEYTDLMQEGAQGYKKRNHDLRAANGTLSTSLRRYILSFHSESGRATSSLDAFLSKEGAGSVANSTISQLINHVSEKPTQQIKSRYSDLGPMVRRYVYYGGITVLLGGAIALVVGLNIGVRRLIQHLWKQNYRIFPK